MTDSGTCSRWFVYLLECGDGSLYSGIAVDVLSRLDAHATGRGAKYTRGRGPLRLLGDAGPFSRGEALRLELELKRLKPIEKRAAFSTIEPLTAAASSFIVD